MQEIEKNLRKRAAIIKEEHRCSYLKTRSYGKGKGGGILSDAAKVMKMNAWKKNAVALAALVAVTVPFAGCATQQKLAVVDYQAILMNHPDLQSANEEMRKTYTELQPEAAKVQNDKGLPEEEKIKKMGEFQKTMMDKQTELFSPIKDDVDQKLDEVMKEKGYISVFSNGALVRGGDDITSDVLRKEGVSEDKIKEIDENRKAQQVNAATSPRQR